MSAARILSDLIAEIEVREGRPIVLNPGWIKGALAVVEASEKQNITIDKKWFELAMSESPDWVYKLC